METYGKILLVAMPAFLLLVLIEKFYGYYRGNDTVRNMDMISSLSSGFTNVIKDVLGISVAIIGYSWMVEHLAIVHIKANWLVYLVAFLALDFSGYWVHRIAHEYNFFWNNHIVHHSSEEFNLACALRQSISVFVRIFTFFLLPAALLGVPGQVIAIVAPIQSLSGGIGGLAPSNKSCRKYLRYMVSPDLYKPGTQSKLISCTFGF